MQMQMHIGAFIDVKKGTPVGNPNGTLWLYFPNDAPQY
jgi:hypothetical protein